MSFKKLFLVVGTIFLIFIVFNLISSEDIYAINLLKGKNNITLNGTELFYVSDLVKINPDIEVVSYKEDGITVGYVNVYGGIGENFIVFSNKEYEIIVSNNMNLILPYQEEKNGEK